LKKRIVSLIIVVTLLAMVLPAAALANDVTVSGTVPGAPTISVGGISPSTGDVSNSPTVTINGTGFVSGQTTVSVSSGATGVTPGAVTFVSSTQITCPFVIAANAASGARYIKVTVYGVDSNTDQTFSVNIYATLAIPTGPISIPASGPLNLSQNNDSAAQTISCTTNEAAKTNATVTVLGTSAGKLTLSSTSLSSALSLGGAGFTTVSLTGSAQTLVNTSDGALSGTPKTWSKNTLVITQPPFTVVTPGSYSCTITLTATFN
jgi:hypothetical protein